MISIFMTAFTTVFVAELVGDKNLVAVLSLGARFRRVLVMGGIIPAVALKMTAAVMFGTLLLQVLEPITSVVTGLVFIFAALLLILNREGDNEAEPEGRKMSRPAALAFGTVFLTEWCDPGQLAAAALAVKYGAPITVGLGGTVALVTKFGLALLVGNRLPRIFPQVAVRYSLACTLFVTGILSFLPTVRSWR